MIIIGGGIVSQAVYSEENFRVLLFYVILPLICILLLFFIGTKIYIYIRKKREKNVNHTNYVVNYWTNVLGILVAAILLSVSIGFSLSFTRQVRELNAIDENLILYYFFMVFPIIPFIFLIIYIRKFIVNMRYSDQIEENDEEENTDEQ